MSFYIFYYTHFLAQWDSQKYRAPEIDHFLNGGVGIHDPAFPRGLTFAGCLSITPAATSLNQLFPSIVETEHELLMNEKCCLMFDTPTPPPSTVKLKVNETALN